MLFWLLIGDPKLVDNALFYCMHTSVSPHRPVRNGIFSKPRTSLGWTTIPSLQGANQNIL